LKNYCVDCGKGISKKAKRCQSCSSKKLHKDGVFNFKGKNNPMYGVHRFGKKNPNYKDGRSLIKAHCIDCGKELKSIKNNRCMACNKLYLKIKYSGEGNPRFGKKLTTSVREKISKSLVGKYSGENSPNFKTGKPKCIDCGKILSNYGRTRCKECFWKSEIGCGNPNYKDGSSLLYYLIRSSKKSDEWRISVFKRDNYTCQECGDNKGHTLEAHHIKSFNEIFLDFLKEYDQFSQIEDKETLVRLAFKHEQFWEVSNGKTLCHTCHKKTKSYGKQFKAIKKEFNNV